ncbi:hypothetical protein P4O66_017901 [Electrophorus voltai]|uniref:Uncharacterized protein n=1 Tax=Electrophorus voltai TaxID=2609070 RepID=A0AAD8YSY5_9TELE|nr:hypothetical protein P4O66_017901 [Electrophorus voltai]
MTNWTPCSSLTAPTALQMMPSLPHFIWHSHIWKKGHLLQITSSSLLMT